MICDRCGKKTYIIYITGSHEKVCERTCKGRQNLYPSSNLKPNLSEGSENERKSFKKIRESLMIGKSELARKANISPITITQIENGMPCRLETKRKILLALGLRISDKNKVFH